MVSGWGWRLEEGRSRSVVDVVYGEKGASPGPAEGPGCSL